MSDVVVVFGCDLAIVVVAVGVLTGETMVVVVGAVDDKGVSKGKFDGSLGGDIVADENIDEVDDDDDEEEDEAEDNDDDDVS